MRSLLRFRFALSALISASFFSTSALASPMIGVDVANSAIESLIISTTLPDLDGGDFTITPQYGMIRTEIVDKPGITDTTTPKPHYSGETSGSTSGVGLTFPSEHNYSFFMYATCAQQTGKFDVSYASAPSIHYSSFKSNGGNAFAGMQYRLAGDTTSFFSMGFVIGPGYYNFKTSVTSNQAGSLAAPSEVKFSPEGLGVVAGLQMLFRIGGFRINPMALGFHAVGDRCHRIEVSGGQLSSSDFMCGGQPGYVETLRTFGGFGLGVGYKALRFNALTFQPAQVQKPIRVTAYTLSLGLSF